MRASVRCYACGAAGAHTSDSCGTCGASLVRLCACGKTVRFGARACAACGGQVTVRRFKPRWTRRRVVVRGALAACACLAVAAVAVSIVRSRACDPARRADAFAAYAAGDKVRALARISPLLEAAPTDVRGWLLRAACERDIGLGKEVFLSSVENAEKIDPTSLEVAQTHISLLAASGLHAEALAVADRALPLHATDTVLLGLHGRACLLAQPPRRLDAYRSFAAARGLGDASNETRILAAFAATLAFGEIPEPLRPVEVTRALAGAEPALAGAGSAVPVGLESAAARVCLTLGRGPTAAVLARRALERATAAGPDRVACRLLVAETALRTGDGAAADREFAAALAESPNSATAQAVVDACDRAGEYARAVGCISTAAGRGDASGGLSLVLARVAMGEGRWDDAERALTQALAADAASGEANLLLGDVRVAQHRPDDARESYRAAADVGLRVPAVTRAALLAISGDVTAAERRDALEEGIAAVRPLVERVDASADDWGQLARLDFAAGRNDVALEEIARATRQAPDRADLHLLEATIAGALGTRDGWSRAERSYAVAAALRPRFGNAAATGAQARCAVGDLTGAIAISTLALQREPARRDVLEIRARAHASLGSWKAAAFDYRELRRLGGAGDPQYAAALVEALCRGGAVSDAAELLDSLRDRIPERTRAELDALLAQFVPDRSVAGPSLVAAQRSFDAGDVDGAAATACAVLASHPGDPAATLVAVLALLEGRDSDLARCAEARRLRDAMALGTKQHLADLADGRLLLAEGAPVEAATRLARAVAAMPESAVAALLYGQALARSHREQEAVEILRKLLAAPRTSPVHRRQSSALLVAAAAAIPPGKRDDAIHGALLADRTNVVLADAWVRTLLERGEPERAAVWCGSILAVDSLPPADAVRFRDAAIRIALELG
ncbi:MAG: tetratricopeptide repeat protein, partial [Planctomycetes bacterium]|nr:tetratricopeptide repeat protein [Planctomycetota bacterium]